MTAGSPDDHEGRRTSREDRGGGCAPVLVLAIGNRLLGDDAAGLLLLDAIRADVERQWGNDVELVDGGTQGLALLGRLDDREAVVFLDAVALGSEPGTIHILRDRDLLDRAASPGETAHETSAGDLLRAAALVGDLPGRIALIGIEPEAVKTGIDLTPCVEVAIPEARLRTLEEIGRALGGRVDGPPRSG